jgi:hypothetical protein
VYDVLKMNYGKINSEIKMVRDEREGDTGSSATDIRCRDLPSDNGRRKRNRPLEEIYAILYIDGQQYKLREKLKQKRLYTVIGMDLDGVS